MNQTTISTTRNGWRDTLAFTLINKLSDYSIDNVYDHHYIKIIFGDNCILLKFRKIDTEYPALGIDVFNSYNTPDNDSGIYTVRRSNGAKYMIISRAIEIDDNKKLLFGDSDINFIANITEAVEYLYLQSKDKITNITVKDNLDSGSKILFQEVYDTKDPDSIAENSSTWFTILAQCMKNKKSIKAMIKATLEINPYEEEYHTTMVNILCVEIVPDVIGYNCVALVLFKALDPQSEEIAVKNTFLCVNTDMLADVCRNNFCKNVLSAHEKIKDENSIEKFTFLIQKED